MDEDGEAARKKGETVGEVKDKIGCDRNGFHAGEQQVDEQSAVRGEDPCLGDLVFHIGFNDLDIARQDSAGLVTQIANVDLVELDVAQLLV